ncbi:MAG: hypothetical protein ACR2L3_05750 [Actinomycetota bacterium]
MLAFLMVSVLVLGACNKAGGGGDAAEDPKGALTDAVGALGETEGISMTFTVESTTESLVAAEGEMTEEDAQKILDSSLSVTASNLSDPENSQAEFVVDIAGNLVEFRALDDTIYLRADVRELTEDFGGDTAEIDAFVAQAPPGFEFAGPLAEGEWIAIEGAKEFSEQMGAPSPDAELQDKFAADLKKAVEDNAEVTSEGSDDQGDHVKATIKVKPLYESLVQSFGTLQVPGAALPDSSEVPDEEIVVDFWVQDGLLSQIQLDITQFRDWEGAEMPEGIEELALNIDLEESDEAIEAPEAAATVDFQQLFQGFLGGMTGSESETAPAAPAEGDVCSQLVGAPPEVLEQFAEECPELQPQ